MRSKEKELNFTDYKQLNCYRYIEENDTIEEPYYQTNDSKLCKYFTSCYYFNIYLCFFFQLTKLRHYWAWYFRIHPKLKEFKIFENVWLCFFFFPVDQLQKGGYILSIETNKHIKAVIVQHILFLSFLLFTKGHRTVMRVANVCMKIQTTNRHFYTATTLATVCTYI